MDTAFIVVIISLFVIGPLPMVLAIANDNDIAKAASVVIAVVCHVIFWVTLGQYGDREVFCFAGLYEFASIVGVFYIVCDTLDLC